MYFALDEEEIDYFLLLAEGLSSSADPRQGKDMTRRKLLRLDLVIQFHAIIEEGPRADLLIPHYNNYSCQNMIDQANTSIIYYSQHTLGFRIRQ